MEHSRAQDFVQFAATTFGKLPNDVERTYQFYESRVPAKERDDFFSLIVLELLEELAHAKAHHEASELIKRVLERVKKRLYRLAARQKFQSLPQDVAASESGAEIARIDIQEEVKSILKIVSNVDAVIYWLYLEGHTLDEISKLTRVTRSTVHRRVTAISGLLRENLHSRGNL